MQEMKKPQKKPQISRLDRAILREFAAEISRLTGLPIHKMFVDRAIEAVKPYLVVEESADEEKDAPGTAEEAD